MLAASALVFKQYKCCYKMGLTTPPLTLAQLVKGPRRCSAFMSSGLTAESGDGSDINFVFRFLYIPVKFKFSVK